MKAKAALFAALLATAIAALAQTTARPLEREASKEFSAIAGTWGSSATVSSSTRDRALFETRTYSWNGAFRGVIDIYGRFAFTGANGCTLFGQAAPFASRTMWSIEAEFEGCPFEHLNQRVFGNLRIEGTQLVLQAKDSPFAVGRPAVAYEINATLSRETRKPLLPGTGKQSTRD